MRWIEYIFFGVFFKLSLLNKITGSGGLNLGRAFGDSGPLKKLYDTQKKGGAKVAQAGEDIYQAGVDALRRPFKQDEPPAPGQGPQGAGAVNAKDFGNVAFASESLYKEGSIPGSINTEQYKK